MKLSDKQELTVSKALVFGAPKTGKTELVGNLAEHYNLIWFDLENGYETLLKLPKNLQEKIELISLPDTRSYPIAIETMLKVIKGGEHTICEEHGKVSCPTCRVKQLPSVTVNLSLLGADTIVVVDSLTQLTNSAIANITKKEPDDYKLTYDDWGNLGKLMDIFLSHVQQAPFNVVCISHESEVEYEDGKKKIVPVSGTRNFSRNSAKYFGHVIYAEVKNKKHQFGSATDYSMSIVTGSRTDVAIEDMKDSSLLPIFNRTVAKSVAQVNSQGVQAQSNLAEKLAAMKAENKS